MYVKHLCYMGRAYAEHMQNVCKVKRDASNLKTLKFFTSIPGASRWLF